MARKLGRDLVHRWKANPIIALEDIPFRCHTVFNAAATKMGDEYILLLRVESLRGISFMVLARSSNGYEFQVQDRPFMLPAEEEPYKTYESRGVEDPRIIQLEGIYYICYTAASEYGPRIALARTKDFRSFERVGLISEPENKDGVLFPRRINGRYARLDRPMVGDRGNIWISYSEDLKYWGDAKVVMTPRGGYWDSDRIGASVPPIETEHGWLEIYHGVRFASSGPIYRLGCVLLDLDDPSRVIGRSIVPILTPREMYERVGDVNNVVFSCGAVVEDDGEVKLYYGAADTNICVGTTTLDELIRSCLDEGMVEKPRLVRSVSKPASAKAASARPGPTEPQRREPEPPSTTAAGIV